MTLQDRLTKNLLFFIFSTYYLGGYTVVNALTAHRPDLHHLGFQFEQSLPFVPVLILVYLLNFALLALTYLVIDDLAYFKRTIKAFFILVTFHFLIFLIYPVEYTLRPAVHYEAGWVEKIVSFYYWVDLPYNCFPSMHISNAFLVGFLLNRYRPGWGKILFPVSVLLAISVVLVKQHYVVDVLAGFVVGYAVFRLIFGPLFSLVPHTFQTRGAPLSPAPR